jgi:hypothetical protein
MILHHLYFINIPDRTSVVSPIEEVDGPMPLFQPVMTAIFPSIFFMINSDYNKLFCKVLLKFVW